MIKAKKHLQWRVQRQYHPLSEATVSPSRLHLFNDDGKDEATIEEEARLRIWESRRGQIRSMLKSAEGVRNFRLENGMQMAVLRCYH